MSPPKDPPTTPGASPIDKLAARVARLEAILHDFGFHEPSCPVRKNQKTKGVHLESALCTCWVEVSP